MRSLLMMALIAPLPAVAFTARNGMEAAQIGPTEIGVAYEAQRADTDYWCAAGDFAERVMGRSSGERLWRVSPEPRKAGQGLVFTLDETRKTEGAGLSQFGKGSRDGSVSIALTGNYCQERRFPPR